jgi:hypothetical protein
LDSPEHVDSENIKLKIGSRPLLHQLFSKCDLNNKMWLKLAKNGLKLTNFQTFFGYFRVFSGRGTHPIQSILERIQSKNETFQKIRKIAGNLFSIRCFQAVVFYTDSCSTVTTVATVKL